MLEQLNEEGEILVAWFENIYSCPECGTEWTDKWSCECGDHCPSCDAEITPKESVDLSRPISEADYEGARFHMALLTKKPFGVSALDAKNYAEAELEGGAFRFEPHTKLT